MIFFLFTALTAQFADLDGFLNPEYSSHRYNAQIVAGVMFHSVEKYNKIREINYLVNFRKNVALTEKLLILP